MSAETLLLAEARIGTFLRIEVGAVADLGGGETWRG